MATTRAAAQYIRMSTDRQDLSPLIQKEAIAAYAAAHALDIVRSFEDEGKSGVELTNRRQLRQLLREVSEGPCFTEILVYDVSRWGRFQDADAAAYYEYHCRMHGVQVIYVGESFPNDQTPATVLLKSMRRVMAAEYSRDIAWKSRAGQQRVISMGFHMGPLPPFGFRRCSVSADGRSRVLLEHGQRKAASTDRIEWVLGPEQEVALVRRICSAYATGFPLEEIAGLVNAEGWRTEKERAVSTQSIKILLKHEALIGNFVWGVKSKGGKIIACTPSRRDGSVPRVIDNKTWEVIQARLKREAATRTQLNAMADPTAQAPKNRSPRQLRLALDQAAVDASYRRTLGSAQQLRNQTREFGRALGHALINEGLPCGFDARTNVLTSWGARVRIRLMWPLNAETWAFERNRSFLEVQHVLIARMKARYCPLDFFVLPLRCMTTDFPREMQSRVPRHLAAFWCDSPHEVMDRLSKICAQAAL